jgi:acetate kinase
MAGLRSADTTMGFTALDGVMMGTRPGTLDPGILLYLMQEKGFTSSELEHLLYHQSGLLGVSGFSADIAELIASSEQPAKEAVELYAFTIARQAAALAATLGGIDRLVFTGGVGEHAPEIRAMVGARLRWMGMEIDEMENGKNASAISSRASRVKVGVIPTDEEGVIARHARQLLS